MKLILTIGCALLIALSSFWLHATPRPSPAPVPLSMPTPDIEPPEPSPPPPSPQADQPTITWSVSELAQTTFPGTTTTTIVTFQSSQSLTNVAVELTPSLNGIVAANPPSFASIIGGQHYRLTVTVTAPDTFEARSFGGTLHLMNAGTPRNTYAAPLAVNIQSQFGTYSDPTSGLSFSYPSSLPRTLSVDTSAPVAVPYHIDVFMPAPDGTVAEFFSISISSNPSKLSLQQWFTALQDPDHLLDGSTALSATALPNGLQALFVTGPVPPSYADQFGPLASAYVLSKDSLHVATIMESTEDPLYEYGYTPDQIAAILFAITTSINF